MTCVIKLKKILCVSGKCDVYVTLKVNYLYSIDPKTNYKQISVVINEGNFGKTVKIEVFDFITITTGLNGL